MNSEPYPTLIFVRHAQSEGNVLTVAERAEMQIGTTAYRLTSLGRRQATCTHDWLQKNFPNPDRVIRSYYQRTAETAKLCYPEEEVREDARLAEANRGVYTILGPNGVKEKMPWETVRRERDGLYHYCPPGGENWPMIESRIRDFRRSIRSRYPGKTVVVFGHGFWILLWQKLTHHWTIEETERRYLADEIVENASVLIYRNEWNSVINRHILQHDPSTDYIVPWKNILPHVST